MRTLLGADLEFLDLHEAARMFLIRVVFLFFFTREWLFFCPMKRIGEGYGRRLCARGDDLAETSRRRRME